MNATTLAGKQRNEASVCVNGYLFNQTEYPHFETNAHPRLAFRSDQRPLLAHQTIRIRDGQADLLAYYAR